MIIDIFTWILAGVTLLNVCYFLYFSKFSFSAFPTNGSVSIHEDPISVIVCAKNEAENLKTLIPEILQQDHTSFELIIVNDYSSDETLEVIERFQKADDRVVLVDVIPNESFWGNKKYALTLGIKKALNDKLLFIDADCVPASNKWISAMSGLYGNEKSIVLGYGKYAKKNKTFLNALIRFETAMSGMQYLSYAMHGNAYMGVGRNLGYTASSFYKVNGFMSHMEVLGGDDDLFINEVATKQNTAVNFTPESFTISIPKSSFKTWWKQKRRHINTSSHYKLKHQIGLGMFFISQLLFVSSAVIALINSSLYIVILGIILLRYLVVWVVAGKALDKLEENDLISFYPLMEIVLLCSHVGLFISNLSKKPTYWE